MDVSFNTWIKPLDVYSVEDNVITLLVPDENIGTSYLHKKYYLPLKVVIQEVTGEMLDLQFLHKSEIKIKKALLLLLWILLLQILKKPAT